jgi:arylformamidase
MNGDTACRRVGEKGGRHVAERIEDLTVAVREGATPVWPGDPPHRVVVQSHLDRGDSATVHRVELGTHTGTHVDAPAHFIRGGGSIEDVPWEGLMGPALLLDAGARPVVEGEDLDALTAAAAAPIPPILLIKTANSHRNLWGTAAFQRDFTALAPSAATWLLAHGVRGVGIDYLSIEPFGSGAAGHPVHVALLAARVAIIEGLDLRAARPGSGRFVCLPLRLAGLEAAPARALWWPDAP